MRAMLGTDLGYPALAPIEHQCARGHAWSSVGGANAGCGEDCFCSVPVHECSRCGECDYGENDEASEIRSACRVDRADARLSFVQ